MTERAKTQRVPTEEEAITAMQEWDEGAAYRRIRHAATVGACYSASTICLAAETFDNQKLTEDLVQNRLAQGEFTATELGPTELGVPSVCEYVSVPLLNRLLRGMQGTFTPEQADHFAGYHIAECDKETLRIIARKTQFSAAERREFLELSDWLVNPEFDPTNVAKAEATQAKQTAAPKKKLGWVKVLLIAGLVPIAAIATIALGPVALVVVAFLAIGLLASGASGQSSAAKDRFPDMRSDYNKRVWADSHNWEADGDTDHNYEADGDLPW